MKLARVIHLDDSDANVFSNSAAAGEWAITGTFAFVDTDLNTFSRKELLGFKEGWLGLSSFGYATLVEVTTMKDSELDSVCRGLATHIYEKYNAPGILTALDAAKNEIKDMGVICQHSEGTLLSIKREISEKEIKEEVRVIHPPPEKLHAKIWTIEDEQ
ncbi:MAG: hypothetical protein CFH06_01023 [Alphaproteobacteria bacterium MarineAlpha3_Bin5]|nr:hypothetical protein [Magnetovibrio sp.]PPR77966.1 MAG: hypothetical protein CFH06_01023 [Alphaproteobacteria bacterium MarineAlpha3_Bin5]|tara:strand:+ start:65 stop:541 length:477 start_codon:yes stop_codon:yes gene_type:complete